MAPLDLVIHKLFFITFAVFIPLAIIGGLLGAFAKSTENWMVRKLRSWLAARRRP